MSKTMGLHVGLGVSFRTRCLKLIQNLGFVAPVGIVVGVYVFIISRFTSFVHYTIKRLGFYGVEE